MCLNVNSFTTVRATLYGTVHQCGSGSGEHSGVTGVAWTEVTLTVQ